jgi:hypothetical protein
MVRVSERTLTEEQFEKAVKNLSITATSRKLAYECMVNREEIKETAERAGRSRGGLDTVIKKIWKEHERIN